MTEDRRAIACNFAEGTPSSSEGGFAFVLDANRGSGGERVRLLAWSRGGHWIDKWENCKRLTSFRWKTVPPSHPAYDRVAWWLTETDLEMLRSATRSGVEIHWQEKA